MRVVVEANFDRKVEFDAAERGFVIYEYHKKVSFVGMYLGKEPR